MARNEQEGQINATELNLSRRIGGKKRPLTPERSGVESVAFHGSTIRALMLASFQPGLQEMWRFAPPPSQTTEFRAVKGFTGHPAIFATALSSTLQATYMRIDPTLQILDGPAITRRPPPALQLAMLFIT